MNFSAGVTEIAGHVAETQLSDTRHPVLRVLPEVRLKPGSHQR